MRINLVMFQHLKEGAETMREENTTGTQGKATTILMAPKGLRGRLRRIARLARKELRESLRDRRTLATLIMMPLIVYPLLGSVVQRFAISRIDPNAPAAIVIFDQLLPPGLQELFAAPRKESDDSVGSFAVETGEGESGKDSDEDVLKGVTGQIMNGHSPVNTDAQVIRLERYVQPAGTDLESILGDASADVAIRELPPSWNPVTGVLQPGELQILSRQGDAFSTRAAAEVEQRVAKFRDEAVRALLDRAAVGRAAMPFVSRVTVESTGPKESPLSAFVPLMLVLMTMTGAVYPAIDLTAGERERGTLEMLIAAPVPRRDLLTGKFVAVFAVAVMTAMINLTAMILTLYGTGFDRVILGDGASVGMFLQVLALLIVFASFFSAVLLSITSFARSFREAQAWLIPLMLVSLAPGILSLMPGVRLTVGLSLIPLVNIVLLGKELFQGIAVPHLFILTLVATLFYTVLALRLAARVFGSDTVLFAGQAGSSPGKRPTELVDSVSLKSGIGSLIILVPTFIVLAGLRSRIVAANNLAGQLVLSGAIMIVLFAMFPILLTIWNRVRFVSAFAIRGFNPAVLIGAILLGSSLWALSYEALLFGKGASGWTRLLSNPRLQEMALKLTQTPLLLRLITLALIPAVTEEFFFRGFLMNSLQGIFKGWKGPLFVSTFLFAAFHVILDPLERFPATFLLGLVLGWIRIRSRSVFPGIAMHAVSNGVLLSLTDLQPLLQQLGLDLAVKNEAHLPTWFLASATAASLIGAVFVRRFSMVRQLRNPVNQASGG